MGRILISILACFIFTQGVYAFDKVNVKYKKVKDIAYEDSGNIYTLPYLLEKGNQWKILEKEKKFYAAINVGVEEDPVEIVLPTTEIDGKSYVNFTYFSKQAGLAYEFNKEKTEVRMKEHKVEEQSHEDGKIILMWDPDLIFDADKIYFTKQVGKRILSPTWGSYKEVKKMPLPLSYLEDAKREGISVTPLMHNDFDLKETKKLINDYKAVQMLAKELAAVAVVYDLDGWNLDFENMDEADKILYTEFIKEVSDQLHYRGKKVSVDITVYSDSPNWSLCYDRGALAEYVDYEVIMGYDQTPRASRYAGSVSSYKWLKAQVALLNAEVPENKLVLGLPFYTRVWTGEDGCAVSSVLTAGYVKVFLEEHKLKFSWNLDDHQYVGTWKEEGQVKKAWFEESRSLRDKISLMHDYRLAGLAFWRYGFESEDMYGNLEEAILNKKERADRYKNCNEDILIKFREKIKRQHI